MGGRWFSGAEQATIRSYPQMSQMFTDEEKYSMLRPGDIVDNLEIQISGRIQNSNFPVWKNALLNQIGLINLKLITDNDFAAATEDAKLLKRAEKTILEAKIRAIEQTEEIQRLFNALDEISEQARQARLEPV
ncbi:hypothetical protein [uncultured Lamprocystis sp.]|jgi:hypothetical protein|uniref:hypothetical protein n=2 Tax=uncultured Lamprocystis sp. TaxID=543132 RepID=UPI0025CC8461|nr:hypothetical protein [uncultured Lamprocystis sp.]